MKGLLLILFFCVSSSLFAFGNDFHFEKKEFATHQFIISSTGNHAQCYGICEEQEFFKLGNEERKDLVPVSSFNNSKLFLRKFAAVSILETYQELQNRFYLYKIGVLRL